jgi:hypothetical protein
MSSASARRNRLLLTVAVLTSACAVRQSQTYRLAPQTSAHVLIPPGVATPAATHAAFTMKFAKGRPCASSADAVTVESRGSKLRVLVARDALLRQAAGWLRQWTTQFEAQGCIPQGTGMDFAARILESVPLDPSAAYRLLHGDNAQQGYVELGPENRLQAQAPILKSGNSPDANVIEIASVTGNDRSLNVDVHESDEAIGVETSWYTLRPKPDGAGTTIVAVSAERRIDGKTEPVARPTRNYFPFAPEIGFYRLIYKADISGKGSTTEIIVGAADRIELDRRTRQVLDDFDTCKVSDPSLCAVIPRHVALNPVMAVTVNGREVRVGIRGTVRGAVRQAGGPQRAEEVLTSLTVRKPYGGKLVDVEFDRTGSAILDMTLLGGESISWK